MYSVDKENFKQYLLSFPEQIAESQKIFKNSTIKLKTDSIRNIIYLGMGGSAIAGDICRMRARPQQPGRCAE